MDSHVTRDGIAANPRIPRVMGILNIVFAAGLMICGVCSLASFAISPVWTSAMASFEKEAKEQEATKRKTQIEEIEAAEKEAETAEQKAELEKRRKDIEKRPDFSVAFKVDMKATGLEDPRIVGWVWADFITGLLLNLLMLSAGIGLVMQRTWGLKLGLWTAGLKLARLFLLYGYAAFVVAPLAAHGLANLAMQSFEQQQKVFGNAPPPGVSGEQVTKVYAVMFAAYAAMIVVLGAIYPAISLWLLSRPGARVACSGSKSAKKVDDAW